MVNVFKSLSEWILSEKKEARSFAALSKKLGFVSRQTLATWAAPEGVGFVTDENLIHITKWLSENHSDFYKDAEPTAIREQWKLSDASQSRSTDMLNRSRNSKKNVVLSKEIEVLLENLVSRIDYLEGQLGEVKGAIAAMSAGNELVINRVSNVEQRLSARGDKVFN